MRESIEPSRVTEHVLFNLPYQPLKASASATATPHPTPPTRQLLAADPTTAAAALDMNPNMFRGYGVSLRPKDPVGTFYASERSTAHNRRQPSPAGWGHHQRTKVGRLAEGSIWAALPQLTLPARHNQTGSFCWTSRAVLPRCHSFDTGKLRRAFLESLQEVDPLADSQRFCCVGMAVVVLALANPYPSCGRRRGRRAARRVGAGDGQGSRWRILHASGRFGVIRCLRSLGQTPPLLRRERCGKDGFE